MHLTFKETKEEVYAAQRVSKHVSPHLHNALEIVCVTEGTLEMGVGQELYHMEKGDIGFVFSDIIHHYQVFSEKTSWADYILVPSSFAGVFKDKIQGYYISISNQTILDCRNYCRSIIYHNRICIIHTDKRPLRATDN